MEDEIRRYIGEGYRLTTRTGTTAQLVRAKAFSTFWAVMWFLLCGVGVFVYLAYWMGKKDDIVYLSVDEHGAVQRVGEKPPEWRWSPGDERWACACGWQNVAHVYDCSKCGTRRPV